LVYHYHMGPFLIRERVVCVGSVLTGWLRSTVVERRYFAGELPCPALDLQLTGDHFCG